MTEHGTIIKGTKKGHYFHNDPFLAESDELKAAFSEQFTRKKGIIHQEKNETKAFFELFDAFVGERGKQNDWTKATFTKFHAVRSHLYNFDPHLELDALNDDKLNIRLNPKALDILEKYKETPFKNKKALPVISNQRMNDYLKELCQLVEINEPITKVYFIGNVRHEEIYPKYSLIGTHTARRTFICNALLNGMPAPAVMKITGHSDYKAMKPYIDIVSRDVDNMVDKFVDF